VRSVQLARPALDGQIDAIRLADSRDGRACGSERLLATHDGGRTWRAAALPGLGRPLAAVEALGVLDGAVDALVRWSPPSCQAFRSSCALIAAK
jgi:photosystem II stability/assembly factor-like uncharacterized protein